MPANGIGIVMRVLVEIAVDFGIREGSHFDVGFDRRPDDFSVRNINEVNARIELMVVARKRFEPVEGFLPGLRLFENFAVEPAD